MICYFFNILIYAADNLDYDLAPPQPGKYTCLFSVSH